MPYLLNPCMFNRNVVLMNSRYAAIFRFIMLDMPFHKLDLAVIFAVIVTIIFEYNTFSRTFHRLRIMRSCGMCRLCYTGEGKPAGGRGNVDIRLIRHVLRMRGFEFSK